MATFSSAVFRRLMRTTSTDKKVLQLQSKRITDNLSDLCPTRVEQNGSKPFEVLRHGVKSKFVSFYPFKSHLYICNLLTSKSLPT